MTSEAATTFDQLGLSAPILRALKEKNYQNPSPIQAQAIPHLLARQDLLGSAQTGTGKTAAFALPILQLLSSSSPARAPRAPRVLILTPTRELAVQIGQSFHDYGRYLHLKHAVIYGGVGQQPQVRAAQNADIAIATPGRLLDLAQQGHIRFDHVEIFVLDEADRMLDMGFAPDIKRIIAKLPAKRQSLLFSATMPPSILQLASKVVHNAVRVAVTPGAPTAELVQQYVCHVEHGQKYSLLRQVLGEHRGDLVLVFARTKHGANKLAKNLDRDGYRAEAIHGNKSQAARQRALENFRNGAVRILVATDVAARGIDVKGIALVINYDIPHEPEAYVHRIGRTARAGKEGVALSFCEPSERRDLRNIQNLIRQTIPVYRPNPQAAAASVAPHSHPAASVPAPTSKPAHAPAAHHTARPAHSDRHSHSERPAHSDRPHYSERSEQPRQSSYAPRPLHPSRPAHTPRDEYSSRPSHSPAQPARSHHAPRSEHPRPASSGHSSHAHRSDYSGRPHEPGPAQHAGNRFRRNSSRSRFGSQRGAWGR